ncbi:MAG: hypothetical protein IV101_07955 [Dechloromonas sp.]|nr:hypothetical protein [Dechloromonas sp.]
MNDAARNGDDSFHLHVRPWVKSSMYAVCLLPIATTIWALLRQTQLPDGNVPVAAGICFAVTGAFAWLFTRLYSLCSIDMNSKGVEQSFALLRGGLGKRVHLRWDQVQHVSFSGHSYHFVARDGSMMELNIALFGDAKATIRAVRMLLPERLLSQLDSEGH